MAKTSFKAVKNNARSTLASGMSAGSGTTATVASGTGSRFPAPATDGNFWVTVWSHVLYADPFDDPNMEIMLCTARSSDTLTVTRAQQGTSSNAHSTGNAIRLLLTEQNMKDIHTASNALEEALILSGHVLATSNLSADTTVRDVAGLVTPTLSPTRDFTIDLLANFENTSSGATKHWYFTLWESVNGGAYSDITSNAGNTIALQGSGSDFRNQGGVSQTRQMTAGNTYAYKARAKVDASTGQITASAATYLFWRVRMT